MKLWLMAKILRVSAKETSTRLESASAKEELTSREAATCGNDLS